MAGRPSQTTAKNTVAVAWSSVKQGPTHHPTPHTPSDVLDPPLAVTAAAAAAAAGSSAATYLYMQLRFVQGGI